MPSLAEIVLEGGRLRSDALRRNAEIVADAQRNKGLLWGAALSNAGQNVAGAFQHAADLKAEAPMRAAQLVGQQQNNALGAINLGEKQKQIADDEKATGIFASMSQQGAHPEDIANALDQAGLAGHAQAMRTQLQNGIAAHSKQITDQLAQTEGALKLGEHLLAGVHDEATFQAATKAIPGMLGKDLGDYVMQQLGDHFDQSRVDSVRAMAQDPATRIATQKAAFEKITQDLSNAKTKTEVDKALTDGASSLLGNATDQADWDAKLKLIGQGSPSVAAKFPAQFSPENKKLALQMGMSPAQQIGASETARHNKAEEANQRAANPNAQVGPVPTGDPNAPHGDDYLKTLPQNTSAMVKALAEGRQPWPSGMALKSPYWQGLLNSVFQYDPTFDTATASNNARVKVRSDFISGKSAQQVNALNTVIGHLGTLSDAADKLGNSDTQFVNTVKNWVSRQAGSPTVTNFDTAKEAVASELVRVWRQAGGSEQDIQDWKKTLDSSQSPSQLKSSVAQIGHLLESKLSSMEEQYQQGMGITGIRLVTPESRAALDKLEGKQPTAPQGTAKVGDTHVGNIGGTSVTFKRVADGWQAPDGTVYNDQFVRIR